MTKKCKKIANFTNGPFAWLSCNLSYLWFFHGGTEVLTIELVLPQFKQFISSDQVLERKKKLTYKTCFSFGALSSIKWFIISCNRIYKYCSWNAQQKAVFTWMFERRKVFFLFLYVLCFFIFVSLGSFSLIYFNMKAREKCVVKDYKIRI